MLRLHRTAALPRLALCSVLALAACGGGVSERSPRSFTLAYRACRDAAFDLGTDGLPRELQTTARWERAPRTQRREVPRGEVFMITARVTVDIPKKGTIHVFKCRAVGSGRRWRANITSVNGSIPDRV